MGNVNKLIPTQNGLQICAIGQTTPSPGSLNMLKGPADDRLYTKQWQGDKDVRVALQCTLGIRRILPLYDGLELDNDARRSTPLPLTSAITFETDSSLRRSGRSSAGSEISFQRGAGG